ncbi:MAG: ABC transporter substrate-binding protein [Chloroflexi bacterium]|nr:ABC transporter substrate-binding protein [Chloroflexota bacterium]
MNVVKPLMELLIMKKAMLFGLVILSIILAGIGCDDKDDIPADQVTVQLKWIHQAQFAGFYVAEQNDLYAEENIDISLIPSGPDKSPELIANNLMNGEIDFAVVGGDQLLMWRSEGKPIVAIAVIFQKNPYGYMTLKDSGIQRPQDLVGKRVMVAPDAEVQHQALLKKLEIAASTIETVPYTRDTEPLISGQIDAHLIYRTGTGLAYDEESLEMGFIWVGDYGIRLYADTIVTSEALIQQNPELVERFLAATLAGWRNAIENQTEAIDITLQYDPSLDRDTQTLMLTMQTPLIHTGENPIGWMKGEVWQETQQILLDGNLLSHMVDVEKTYTMQFLNKIYNVSD